MKNHARPRAERLCWVALALCALGAAVVAYGGRTRPVDQDVPEILAAIDARGGLRGCPSWFSGDWPLANGLYRPVAACAFAFERTLLGDWAPGYRLVSWALLVLTAVLLALLVQAVGARREAGPLAGTLFLADQYVTYYMQASPWGIISAGAAGAMGWLLFRAARAGRGAARGHYLAWFTAAGTVTWVLLSRPVLQLPLRWIAAQTVVLCALFAVCAALALLRYTRAGRARDAVLFAACVALALGAHEQGVFLPLLMGAIALAHRRGAARSPWLLVAASVLLTLGYLAVRRTALGPAPGVYQLVTIRPSVIRLQLWLWHAFPPIDVLTDWTGLYWNPWMGLDAIFWQIVARHLGVAAAALALARSWRAAWPFLWWHAAAGIPLAMVRWMDHYLLLPDVGTCALAGILVASALGRTSCRPGPGTALPREGEAPSEPEGPAARTEPRHPQAPSRPAARTEPRPPEAPSRPAARTEPRPHQAPSRPAARTEPRPPGPVPAPAGEGEPAANNEVT